MKRAPFSAERISVAVGLCVLMLAALPRYVAGGHETRQTLIGITLAVVASVVLLQWRLLGVEARQRIPPLLKRLALMMVVGLVAMGLWHALFTTWISWQVFISHAATLGLILHALSLGWTGKRQG
tara:strand:- start:12871 stop:13245 length:375 start_codon:yes stop_codon:yes gene_type:complete